MRPQEIVTSLSTESACDLFRYLQKEQKAAFRTCLATLAAARKLRPVFIERKPPEQRYVWMQREVGRAGNENIAANLLHIWLGNAKKSMIITYLDALEIEHDGDGGIDSLPDEPAEEKVAAAVEQLLEKFPHEEVAAYLHAFQSMEEQSWASLDLMLREDARLKLGEPGASEEAGAAEAEKGSG